MQNQTKTVYILGAGCSAGQPPAGPGFPLACEFAPSLDEFSHKMLAGGDCGRLKSRVDETVKLLHQEKVQTLDTLVARLAAEARNWSTAPTERNRLDRQVRDAKIATTALFLHLETKAKEAGLPRHDNFLSELFGNFVNWAEASQKSRCHVLSFNYDRLFEMAFLSRFKPDTGQYPLYGKRLLNSGLDFVTGTSISFDVNRFSLLKLRGSAGIRVTNAAGNSDPCIYTYYDGQPGGDGNPINDERFFPQIPNRDPHEGDPEPLIVFPHEKPFVAPGIPTRLPCRNYIPAVWERAGRLVAEATTIWAIGYSFAPIDRDDVVALLRQARRCKTLVVQNRPEAVEAICRNAGEEVVGTGGAELESRTVSANLLSQLSRSWRPARGQTIAFHLEADRSGSSSGRARLLSKCAPANHHALFISTPLSACRRGREA